MTVDLPLSLDFSLTADDDRAGLASEAHLGALVRSVLVSEGASGPWEIAVALVSDDELQSLHQQFMGINEPTDIMTFPYGEGTQGGDLAISADHARSRGAEWGNSPEQEIEFLVAHGVLHLLGWHDASPEQRSKMLDKQQELVSAWHSARGS